MKDNTCTVRAQHAVPVHNLAIRTKSRQNRQSIRLRGFDYNQTGMYFVTICTHKQICLFGKIVDNQMLLNNTGGIVQKCWDEIPLHFPHIETDAFVIMPNHVHGIVIINEDRGMTNLAGAQHASASARTKHAVPLRIPISRTGTACRAPTPLTEKFGHPVAGAISTIVRSFKSAATRQINEFHNSPGAKIWQRNYWDRIIRNEDELTGIREYILNNPAQWVLDKLFVIS